MTSNAGLDDDEAFRRAMEESMKPKHTRASDSEEEREMLRKAMEDSMADHGPEPEAVAGLRLGIMRHSERKDLVKPPEHWSDEKKRPYDPPITENGEILVVEASQELNISLSLAWDYFSSPNNLSNITPPKMGFIITSKVDRKAYPGQIITYKVSPISFVKTKYHYILRLLCYIHSP